MIYAFSAPSPSLAPTPFEEARDQNTHVTLYEAWKTAHPLQHEQRSVVGGVTSYMEADLPEREARCLAELVGEYAQNAVVFGPRDYRLYYGVDVGEDELPQEALDWWNSLDAVTPYDAQGNPIYNYETHHGFYYDAPNYNACPNPNWLTPGIPGNEDKPMDLEAFDGLARAAEERPTRFAYYNADALLQNNKIRAVEPSWIAPRKKILFRNESPDRQRALMKELNTETRAQMQAMAAQPENRHKNLKVTEYENFPNLRALTIIARAHLAKTEKRLLGDETGFEQQLTYSRTEQTVMTNREGVARTYQVVAGANTPQVVIAEGYEPSGGLDVRDLGDFSEHIAGVMGLQRFPGRQSLEY